MPWNPTGFSVERRRGGKRVRGTTRVFSTDLVGITLEQWESRSGVRARVVLVGIACGRRAVRCGSEAARMATVAMAARPTARGR